MTTLQKSEKYYKKFRFSNSNLNSDKKLCDENFYANMDLQILSSALDSLFSKSFTYSV